jgi:hypothetical protein
MDRRQLMDHLDACLVHAMDVIRGLSRADLERTWNMQGFQGSGLAILLHVVGHFGYPVGQITLHPKLMKDMATGCYASLDLERKGPGCRLTTSRSGTASTAVHVLFTQDAPASSQEWNEPYGDQYVTAVHIGLTCPWTSEPTN